METRDRVMVSISDWVSQRVKDPLVEIDPVTVNEAITAEQESEEPTVATSTSPSLLGHLPPGFPKGADNAAIAAGIVLLLAALGTAVILALLRGKKRAGSATHFAPGGPEANGSVTNGGARQDDRKVTWHESRKQQPVSFVTSSLENQATTHMPFPKYSPAMDKSDLPLPPSFGGSRKDKQIDPPSSSSADDDRVVPFVTRPDDAEAPPVKVEEEEEAEANETVGVEVVGSNNGVGKGDSALEGVAAELNSAAVALDEKLTTKTIGSEEEGVVELGSVEDSPSPEGLPSASESLEGELADVCVGVEYILIGDSDTLSPVGHFVAPRRPPRTLPAGADAGVPVDSSLVDESSAAQPPSKKTDVLPPSAHGAVVGRSIGLFEGLQAGPGAEVSTLYCVPSRTYRCGVTFQKVYLLLRGVCDFRSQFIEDR